MLSKEIEDKLKGFTKHGFVYQGMVGNQAVGICPFTGKDRKFYINIKTLLWDSKTANYHGNFTQFLQYVHQRNKKGLTPLALKNISIDRKLPVAAFNNMDLGYWNKMYTIPVYNKNGSVVDLRTYNLGKRSMSTPTCHTGIYRFLELIKSDVKMPVYLCEGEWDTIALTYLFKLQKKNAVILGIPGANTFKKEWAQYFKGRHVNICYDNDGAGEDGEHQVIKALNGVAKSFKFLHWPESLPSGYDVRDYIISEAIKNKRPNRCFTRIHDLLKDTPRKQILIESKGSNIDKPILPRDKSMTWMKLSETVHKWLRLKNLNTFLVTTAVVLSNKIEGDPLWVFIVAAPGEGKSETLNTIKDCLDVFTTSSITPNALISGAVGTKTEPSLLPKLDGKTLCIKDFSAIQTMRETDRDALLGILRDAYDGTAGKVFGTGETKNFSSRFSIIAGTTPAIYELDSAFSALGERFLKFFQGEYVEHRGQLDVCMRAMNNVGKETNMREELSKAVYSFVENTKEMMSAPGYKMPELTKEMELRIANLAVWCAKIKGTVNRDKWDRDIITTKAYTEVGTRTSKQLKRFILCLPTTIINHGAGDVEYNLAKKVALDTVSAKREDIFRCIYLNCQTKDDSIDIKKIENVTLYGYQTITRVVDDLIALGILERIGVRKPYQYRITEQMRLHTESALLYKDDLTRNRISRSVMLSRSEENGISTSKN